MTRTRRAATAQGRFPAARLVQVALRPTSGWWLGSAERRARRCGQLGRENWPQTSRTNSGRPSPVTGTSKRRGGSRPRRAEHPVPPRPGWPARPWIARWRGSRTSGGGNPNLRSAIPRSRRWLGGIDPRSGRRLAAAGLAGVQPAVVGMGTGDVAVGGVSPADGTAPGLASASAVVVTGPAELPLNQADQDSCQ